MALLWFGTELAIEAIACWTLGVHACMALGAPAWWVWPFTAMAWLAVARAQPGRWRSARAGGPAAARFALGALAIGFAFAIPALFRLTASEDDFNYFHRVLWQVERIGEPFARGDTAFNVAGLAAISPLHQLTTWELGAGLNAALVGLDPLGAYHNASVVFVHLALAMLFALWARELGFGRRAAWAGCAAVFVFFLVDDATVRSWAIGYRMLWVGKMVQWLWLLPVALLFAFRYLRAPRARTLLHPLLCGVAAVGISGTGVFLLPGVFAAASVAGLALGPRPWSWRRVVECGLLSVGSLYCFLIAALLFSGVLEGPVDRSAWTTNFPGHWSDNLMLVTGGVAGWLRNAWFVLAVPALCLTGAPRVFLLVYSAAVVVLFTNPIAGPLWIEATQPGAYWRVAFLFAVPLGVVVCTAALFQGSFQGSFRGSLRGRSAVAFIVGVAAIGAARALPLAPDTVMPHRFETKRAFELRLPPKQLRFLRPVAAELAGRSLLGAPGVATAASLLVPSLRLEAARLKDTLHVFSNAGDRAEGERRVAAWSWMRLCRPDAQGARAALRSLRRAPIADGAQRVDALIFSDCGPAAAIAEERARVLSASGGQWREVSRAEGFVLYLRS